MRLGCVISPTGPGNDYEDTRVVTAARERSAVVRATVRGSQCHEVTTAVGVVIGRGRLRE